MNSATMAHIQPLQEADIADMQTWVYPPPYGLYSFAYIPPEEALAFFTDPANGYFGLYGPENELLGFCNFGDDACVEGFNYPAGAVDVGIGMRPDLTGRGRGAEYAGFVFREAAGRFPGLVLRVTIASFNERAQKVCEQNGFRELTRFERPSDGLAFTILVR